MNRLVVVLVALAGTFSGCTKDSKAKESTAEVVVPQVEGLALIHPKISGVAILRLEKLADSKAIKASPQEVLLKRIQRNDQQIESLKVQLETLEAERTSANYQHLSGHEQLRINRSEKSPPRDILELYKENRKSELTAFQIKMVEDYLNASDRLNQMGKEYNRLEQQSKDLGLWDTYIGSKGSDLQKDLERANANYETSYEESLRLHAEITKENNRLIALHHQTIEKAQFRNLESQTKLSDIGERIHKIDIEIANLRGQVEKLKADSSDAQIEINQLPALAKKSILEPLYASKKLALARALNEGRKVSLPDLIDVLILRDSIAYGPAIEASDDIKTKLGSFAEGDQSTAIFAFKMIYENRLAQSAHQGRRLIYNKKAVTLAHPIRDGKMQCYSGTNLFLTLNEMRQIPFRNLVVIFTEGHVLPGFISVKDGVLNLTGIETTVEGKGVKNFGPTREIEGRIRVFDNHQYLLTELFKGEIENFNEVYKQMLATVANYGFQTEKLLGLETLTSSTADADTLNASPLGFGNANVPNGDLVREKVDYEESLMFRAQQGKPATAGFPATTLAAEPEPNFPCSAIQEMDINLSKTVYCRDEKGRRTSVSEYLNKNVESRIDISLILVDETKIENDLVQKDDKIKCVSKSHGQAISVLAKNRDGKVVGIGFRVSEDKKIFKSIEILPFRPSKISDYIGSRNMIFCDQFSSELSDSHLALKGVRCPLYGNKKYGGSLVQWVNLEIRCPLEKPQVPTPALKRSNGKEDPIMAPDGN